MLLVNDLVYDLLTDADKTRSDLTWLIKYKSFLIPNKTFKILKLKEIKGQIKSVNNQIRIRSSLTNQVLCLDYVKLDLLINRLDLDRKSIWTRLVESS